MPIIALAGIVALALAGCTPSDQPAREVDAVNATPTEFEAALPALDRPAPARTETATFALG
jgi:hypothetical protein